MRKENKTIFSIVVCTFNGEKHIRKCLDSLMKLDFPKSAYEIIVVDDCSTDSTKEIVREYPVRLLEHTKNQGIAGARNTGLKNVKGKIYVCFDDDCYVEKSWLKNLEKAYKDTNIKDLNGVGGVIRLSKKGSIIEKYLDKSGYGNPSPVYYGKSKNPLKRFYAYLKGMFAETEQDPKNILEVSEIWGANCSFPVETLKKINGWDETLSGVEDTDLCDRIKKAFPNKKFLCVQNAVLYHDHQLSLKSFLLKPYQRGPAILAFYQKNNKIPPVFPFPLGILLLSIFALLITPLHSALSLLLLPLAFYSWWIIKAIKQKDMYILLFPFIQVSYEFFSILGLVKGYIQNTPKITISFSQYMLAGILFFGAITNFFIINNVNYYFLREILATIYILFLPGLLISWAAKLQFKGVWELFAYSVGISIVSVMLFGLSINYAFPYLYTHISLLHNVLSQKPLSLPSILYSFDFLLGLLWTYILIRKNSIPFEIVRSFSIKNILFGLVPVLFPVLAIMGAVSLNNNASNIFTMIMIAAISFFIFILVVLRDKISEHIFPWTLFMIALSLLFMTSLRGWYITGHDINLEYFVFQLTKAQGIWKITNFQDPYNACLSITILPTIVSILTHIKDAYIYKIIFQILFSTSIITTYLFIRKFLSPYLAFLGTFVIVSLPTFMTDMPMLNRQEIALLFFALLLNTLFTKHFPKLTKFSVFVVFALGMLVSHYSTTYLALLLFLMSYLMHIPLRLATLHRKTRSFAQKIYQKLGFVDSKPNLHVGMVLILVVTTILWNVNITNTSSGIVKTVTKVFNLLHASKVTNPSPYVLATNKNPSEQTLLNIYIDTTTKLIHKFNDDTAFLSKNIYSQYPVSVAKGATLPLTNFGQELLKLHIRAFTINDVLKQLYAKIIQIFIVVGFVAIFFLKKHISNFEKEYLILTISFFVILMVQVLLPNGSIDYGLLRLFQQGMILFSLPLIIGGLALLSIFDKIHKSIKIYGLTFIFVLFFLYLSGFIPNITGGYYPQLNVNNGGFYYDAYYTSTTDILSMTWLNDNGNKKTPVQSDWFALNKIHAYEKFYTIDAMIPSSIRINSYVYLSTFNTTSKSIIEYVNSDPIYYTYDFAILNNNKNLIYSNGNSKIYR